MNREDLVDISGDDELLFADGFDTAIIGVSAYTPNHPPRVVYDVQKMVVILSSDMTEEEALEYLEFNTFGAYVGERTPIYVEYVSFSRGDEPPQK